MGSDGGRGSYGGEREWCRALERGSSPGLVIAHVFSWPVSVHRCQCPRIVAHACASLPMHACHFPCLHVVPSVHMSFPASIHVCGQSFSFVGVGGSLHLWAVSSFVGGPSSFVGNGTVWWWGAIGGWW